MRFIALSLGLSLLICAQPTSAQVPQAVLAPSVKYCVHEVFVSGLQNLPYAKLAALFEAINHQTKYARLLYFDWLEKSTLDILEVGHSCKNSTRNYLHVFDNVKGIFVKSVQERSLSPLVLSTDDVASANNLRHIFGFQKRFKLAQCVSRLRFENRGNDPATYRENISPIVYSILNGRVHYGFPILMVNTDHEGNVYIVHSAHCDRKRRIVAELMKYLAVVESDDLYRHYKYYSEHDKDVINNEFQPQPGDNNTAQ